MFLQANQNLIQIGRWPRVRGRLVLLILPIALVTLMLGCSERTLPPEVPYTDDGVTEIRELLGTNDDSAETTDSPEDDTDESR